MSKRKRPSLKRLKFEKYLFTILMVVSFTTRLGNFVLPQSIPKILSIVIFIYALVRLKQYPNFCKKRINTCLFMAKMYLLPTIILHLYSIVMICFGQMESSYLNTNLSAYAPILVAISSIYLFGNATIKYIFVAICISWTSSIIVALFTQGIGIFPYAIMEAYFGNFNPILGVNLNFFEIHDLVLSIGLFAIYYLYSRGRILKKDLPKIAIFLVIFLLGMKRIALLGLICSIMFILFINRIKQKKYLRVILFVTSALILLISFLFIIFIFNANLEPNIGNVNLMGRNYYYNTIKKHGTISPFFLGTGRNSVTKILTTKYSYLHVGGVHSDILKMYIENGFVMFFVWLWYYLFKLPSLLKRKFGTKTAILYISLIIYTFILYSTDNVENYFIFQLILTCMPVGFYLSSNRTTEKVKTSKQRTAVKFKDRMAQITSSHRNNIDEK